MYIVEPNIQYSTSYFVNELQVYRYGNQFRAMDLETMTRFSKSNYYACGQNNASEQVSQSVSHCRSTDLYPLKSFS